MTVSRVRVRYAETDQMGFAYHAHYLVWCEIGRTDSIRAVGDSYAELERDGLRLAVVEAAVRYIASATYDDELRIETTVTRVQSRSVTFDYRVVREAPGPETLLATATTRLVALGREGRPTRMPDALVRALDPARAAGTGDDPRG